MKRCWLLVLVRVKLVLVVGVGVGKRQSGAEPLLLWVQTNKQYHRFGGRSTDTNTNNQHHRFGRCSTDTDTSNQHRSSSRLASAAESIKLVGLARSTEV
jgi:hypothetical protein